MKTTHIDQLGPASGILTQVQQLWRANSRTLGNFPRGAFEEYAASGNILVAVADNTCLGYLLYRDIAGGIEVALTHLCVAEEARGGGIARRLVDELKERTKKTRGIGLWCRRDYEARNIWPRFGFVWRRDRPGRGAGSGVLDFYWFAHEHSDLLTPLQENEDERPIVALDTNIALDLMNRSADADNETVALDADWMVAQVQYAVTAELFNEIARREDRAQRKQQKDLAQKLYRELPTDDMVFRRIMEALDSRLGPTSDLRDASDRRQLARAISGGADFFITQDRRLINAALSHSDLVGLPVLRPGELLRRIDALIRDYAYRPGPLRGTSHISDPGATAQLREVKAVFLNHESGEKRTEFERTIDGLLTAPRSSVLRIVRSREGDPLGLLGLSIESDGVVSIRLCRTARGSHTGTIAYVLLEEAILETLRHRRQVCVMDDGHADTTVTEAAPRMGFVRVGQSSVKLVLCGVVGRSDVASSVTGALAPLSATSSDIAALTQRICGALDQAGSHAACMAEKLLWPLKIRDLPLPCWIVPIKPVWAAKMFDDDLARQDLFGASPDLMFRRTNAYYRSARPCGLTVPGRILWYVSSSDRFCGASAIRACSYLDEVAIDTAKALFSRFRRLGVYDWRDVRGKSNNEGEVMALVFSDTERLDRPISFADVQGILSRYGLPANRFQSPVKIPPGVFMDIYERGQP